jgi:hypothetical protein
VFDIGFQELIMPRLQMETELDESERNAVEETEMTRRSEEKAKMCFQPTERKKRDNWKITRCP